MGKGAALIGYTGFIGSNILNQKSFTNVYNSKNIEEIRGREFELLVCAGASGTKWLANKEPRKNLEAVTHLMLNLSEAKIKKLVLISTIDVYQNPSEVDEDSPIQKAALAPYGKHRRMLEEFVEDRFDSTIVRLPGLFGKGLKKNIIYDLLQGSTEFIHPDGILQFYNLDYIYSDIEKALSDKLQTINVVSEPLPIRELSEKVFGIIFDHTTSGNAPYYDVRSKYGHLWGSTTRYLYPKSKIMADLNQFKDTVMQKS